MEMRKRADRTAAAALENRKHFPISLQNKSDENEGAYKDMVMDIGQSGNFGCRRWR